MRSFLPCLTCLRPRPPVYRPAGAWCARVAATDKHESAGRLALILVRSKLRAWQTGLVLPCAARKCIVRWKIARQVFVSQSGLIKGMSSRVIAGIVLLLAGS